MRGCLPEVSCLWRLSRRLLGMPKHPGHLAFWLPKPPAAGGGPIHIHMRPSPTHTGTGTNTNIQRRVVATSH